MNKTVLALVIILIFSLLLISYFDGEVRSDIFSMDTVISVNIKGSGRKTALSETEKEIERLNDAFSVNGNGVLARYNKGEEADGELSSIIKECEELKLKTAGAFDIGIYPVTKLWGFTQDEFCVPSDGEIEKALKKSGEEIDLGAYLKGYGADRIREILLSANVPEATISLGGTVLLFGNKDKEVALASPDNDGYACYIKTKECVISTSGGYERNFEADGKIYSHIINPKTGYPAESGIKSATVISKSGVLSDSFSTAVYVMGEDEAKKLYGKENFEFLLITEDDRLIISEGLEGKVYEIDGKYKVEIYKKS